MNVSDTSHDDLKIAFAAPLDIFDRTAVLNSAKKVGADINFRTTNIAGLNSHIFNQVRRRISSGRIPFLALGDVIISENIRVESLGVQINASNPPSLHSYFRTYCYSSTVSVSNDSDSAITDAFDRLESALNLISAAKFGVDLQYYVQIPHGPITFIDKLQVDEVRSAESTIENRIAELTSKQATKYKSVCDLLRKSQTSLSVHEAYLLTWSAFEVACGICVERFILRQESATDLSIVNEMEKENVTTIDEARIVIAQIDKNSTQKRVENALRNNLPDAPDHAERILSCCFTRNPRETRLYNLRNKIAHGAAYSERKRIWEVAYRLSELNEFAPHFALKAPFGSSIQHRESVRSDGALAGDSKVLVTVTALDENGIPIEGLDIKVHPVID